MANKENTRFRNGFYRNYGKRWLDIAGSFFGLIALAPVLIFVAILVRWKLGSPVFFRQRRPGLYGEPFEMLKFRTMTDTKDENGNLLPDEKRLTRLGKFLRKTSLDEFPELWNVLKGDMSLVGPRPLMMEYLPLYNDDQAKRHNVRPGVTGWAQVNGRNAISWEKKFEFDLWYTEHQSFWIDVKILFLTVWKIVRCDGISAKDCVTMPCFQGTNNQTPVMSTSNLQILGADDVVVSDIHARAAMMEVPACVKIGGGMD